MIVFPEGRERRMTSVWEWKTSGELEQILKFQLKYVREISNPLWDQSAFWDLTNTTITPEYPTTDPHDRQAWKNLNPLNSKPAVYVLFVCSVFLTTNMPANQPYCYTSLAVYLFLSFRELSFHAFHLMQKYIVWHCRLFSLHKNGLLSIMKQAMQEPEKEPKQKVMNFIWTGLVCAVN